jgi:hypothetical protein
MYDLYFTYDESSTGGEPINPEERWTDYTDANVYFAPRAIFANRDDSGMFAHGLVSEEIFGEFERGDIGHLLIVRYSTGDTFSHTNGYWKIIGFYKDAKEAIATRDKIEDDSYEGHKPWFGYFESLENIELHTLVVQ